MRHLAVWVSFLLFIPTAQAKEGCDSLQLSQALPVRTPEAPPELGQKQRVTPLGCKRTFQLGDSPLRLDPYHAQNADNLRPLLAPYPEAVSYLDRYQANLRKANISAYTGTVGILSIIAAFVISGNMDSNPDLASTLKWSLLASGLGITVGSFVITFAVLQHNHGNLERAAQIYNQAHPNSPIGLSVHKEFQ